MSRPLKSESPEKTGQRIERSQPVGHYIAGVTRCCSQALETGWANIIPNGLEYTLQVQVGEVEVTAPIPEPETYAMLLAGLGLLGFMARRKNNAT